MKALETKKDRYKDAANQCNKEIEQLSKRMREMSTQIGSVKQEYEVKIAQKDGDITRLERIISETKASLHDKSFQYTKHQTNLSNEVQALSDRIQGLERDKLEMIDRYGS